MLAMANDPRQPGPAKGTGRTRRAGDARAATRRRRARALSADARAGQILEAASAVFVAKGFAGARIEDVARHAGVAKGTVYLHFASKQELFKEIVRASILPAVGRLELLIRTSEAATDQLLRQGLMLIAREVFSTDRRHILRLMLTEGHRFPEIAGFYHAEVVSRGLGMIRLVLERGRTRGEVRGDALIRFPQLLVAPVMLAILWEGLFGHVDPLDTDALFAAHFEVISQALRGGGR
jgi:AcrR family transcriptional regulator